MEPFLPSHCLDAEDKAREIIDYTHSPSIIIVEIVESGDRQTSPSIVLDTVNEDFKEISVFSVDAGTEFLWALAAVIGCFSMILIPSFHCIFRCESKRKEERTEIKAGRRYYRK